MSAECTGLHAAYEALRAEPNKENYSALMEAFEADIRADAHGFEPLKDAESRPTEGAPLQWSCLETPKGRMLALFTSRAEVEKHPAPASVGVKLAAFVKAALADEKLAGLVINPFDGHHGFPVERRNLQVLAVRAGLAGKTWLGIHPALIEQVYMGLFKVAVGVPTPVYDIQRDLEALGGAEKTLKPVLDRWAEAAKRGDFKPADVREGLLTILRDVLSTAFVRGTFVRKDPAIALEADPADCLARVPSLKEDIEQNLNEFLIILFGFLRVNAPALSEEQLWQTAMNNLGPVAFGVFCFGLGWGIGKYAEGLPDYEQIALREHEADYLKDLETRRNEAYEKARAQAEQEGKEEHEEDHAE